LIQFLNFPFHVANSTGIHAEYVGPRTPGGGVPLKAEMIGVIQDASVLEMLTDAAQSHTDDVLWD